jgi:hypothetical protein
MKHYTKTAAVISISNLPEMKSSKNYNAGMYQDHSLLPYQCFSTFYPVKIFLTFKFIIPGVCACAFYRLEVFMLHSISYNSIELDIVTIQYYDTR